MRFRIQHMKAKSLFLGLLGFATVLLIASCEKDSGTAEVQELSMKDKAKEFAQKRMAYYIGEFQQKFSADASWHFADPPSNATTYYTGDGGTQFVNPNGGSSFQTTFWSSGTGSMNFGSKVLDFDLVVCGEVWIDYYYIENGEEVSHSYEAKYLMAWKGDGFFEEDVGLSDYFMDFISFNHHAEGEINLDFEDMDVSSPESGNYGAIYFENLGGVVGIPSSMSSAEGTAQFSNGKLQFSNVVMVDNETDPSFSELASGNFQCVEIQ